MPAKTVWVTEEEWAGWHTAAQRLGISRNGWIRTILRDQLALDAALQREEDNPHGSKEEASAREREKVRSRRG